jgi:hypothetical protein
MASTSPSGASATQVLTTTMLCVGRTASLLGGGRRGGGTHKTGHCGELPRGGGGDKRLYDQDWAQQPIGERALGLKFSHNGARDKPTDALQIGSNPLSPPPPSHSSQAVVYSTISGALGALVTCESREVSVVLLQLEEALRRDASLFPTCRDQLTYRSALHPSRGVSDGDLVDQAGPTRRATAAVECKLDAQRVEAMLAEMFGGVYLQPAGALPVQPPPAVAAGAAAPPGRAIGQPPPAPPQQHQPQKTQGNAVQV